MRYIVHILAVFLTDGVFKAAAERKLSLNREIKAFDDAIKLKLYHNKGAMLDLSSDNPYRVRIISAALTCALMLFLIASLIRGERKGVLTALSLVIGGALSNTYDRFAKGYVTDYISFPILERAFEKVRMPKFGKFFGSIVFNISDFFIIFGSAYIVLREMSR